MIAKDNYDKFRDADSYDDLESAIYLLQITYIGLARAIVTRKIALIKVDCVKHYKQELA